MFLYFITNSAQKNGRTSKSSVFFYRLTVKISSDTSHKKSRLHKTPLTHTKKHTHTHKRIVTHAHTTMMNDASLSCAKKNGSKN